MSDAPGKAADFALEQAEHCEEMAAAYPHEREMYQRIANAWRTDLASVDMEPVDDAILTDAQPGGSEPEPPHPDAPDVG